MASGCAPLCAAVIDVWCAQLEANLGAHPFLPWLKKHLLQFDSDHNGSIDRSELRQACKQHEAETGKSGIPSAVQV